MAIENTAAIVAQWRGLHALPKHPTSSETYERYSRAVWRDDLGMDAIELYRIPGMGHGVPIDASTGYGRRAPFIDVGVPSTIQIATS
ncbi:hypothetical protein [Ensifer sp. 4252]|uniref:hypothetical protein n=1 Tax=Ensifer sp. 4252 TaxID=3373915 RepID=UPI003D1FAF2E